MITGRNATLLLCPSVRLLHTLNEMVRNDQHLFVFSSSWPWHKWRKTRSQAEAKRCLPVGTGCLALYPKKSNRVNLWHKQACGWKHKHERLSTSFSLQQSQTSTLCSTVSTVIATPTAPWPFYFPISHPLFIHHCRASPLPFWSLCSHPPSFLFLLFLPLSFSGLCPKADGPCKQMLPTQSMWRKTKPGSKANRYCWRGPRRWAGRFTV